MKTFLFQSTSLSFADRNLLLRNHKIFSLLLPNSKSELNGTGNESRTIEQNARLLRVNYESDDNIIFNRINSIVFHHVSKQNCYRFFYYSILQYRCILYFIKNKSNTAYKIND